MAVLSTENIALLKSPHISEKATDLAGSNQYVFKVAPTANKPEIKKIVGNIYKVKVEKVRMVRISAKPKRLGRYEGWRKAYKKAIVTLKEGHKIEILPR